MNISKIKSIIIIFISLFIAVRGICQHINPSIKINVINISAKKGDVLVALYNSDKGFPGEKTGAVKFARGKLENGISVIEFENIEAGTYAVALFHDTNGDDKLNFNFLGIPKEGYGFSNNARNMFSAPSFKQASFKHEKETKLEIKMRY